MSEGPIKLWRDAHRPERVSVPDARRVCMTVQDHGYCGRRSSRRTGDWAAVSCPDCRAAARADGRRPAPERVRA